MTRGRRLALAVAALGASGIALLLSAYVLPPTLLIGPCLRDWTSPSSYRPRASKLATVRFEVDGEPLKVCYGRPVAKGRVIFGALVPYDRLWRTGANEPTRLFTSVAIDFAGIHLTPGRYSLYSIPRAEQWDLFVTRSTFHWGNAITRDVRDREVGSATLPVQTLEVPVDTLTIRPVETPVGVTLIVEWERTRIAIPVAPAE